MLVSVTSLALIVTDDVWIGWDYACGTEASSGPFVHLPDDSRVNMEQKFNDINMGKLIGLEKDLPQYHFIHHKDDLCSYLGCWYRFLGTSQLTNPVSLAYFCLTLLQWYEATASSFSWLEVDWNRMSIVAWPWCDVTTSSGARTERKCTRDANTVPTVGRWLICCLYRTIASFSCVVATNPALYDV
jgi:hypothetical protein